MWIDYLATGYINDMSWYMLYGYQCVSMCMDLVLHELLLHIQSILELRHPVSFTTFQKQNMHVSQNVYWCYYSWTSTLHLVYSCTWTFMSYMVRSCTRTFVSHIVCCLHRDIIMVYFAVGHPQFTSYFLVQRNAHHTQHVLA